MTALCENCGTLWPHSTLPAGCCDACVHRSWPSRLPTGEWRCIRDGRTEPCGECPGCREVQAENAANDASTPSDLPSSTGTKGDS